MLPKLVIARISEDKASLISSRFPGLVIRPWWTQQFVYLLRDYVTLPGHQVIMWPIPAVEVATDYKLIVCLWTWRKYEAPLLKLGGWVFFLYSALCMSNGFFFKLRPLWVHKTCSQKYVPPMSWAYEFYRDTTHVQSTVYRKGCVKRIWKAPASTPTKTPPRKVRLAIFSVFKHRNIPSTPESDRRVFVILNRILKITQLSRRLIGAADVATLNECSGPRTDIGD